MDETDRQQASSSSSNSTESRTLRSSARVKAAKDKVRTQAEITASSASAKGKGKAKAAASNPKRNFSGPLTINEPARDVKGKKRAIQDPSSDEDSPSTSAKRARTTSYSLRSLGTVSESEMPRKTRTVGSKGKAPSEKAKAPMLEVAGSSRLGADDDVEMVDAEFKKEEDVDEATDEKMDSGIVEEAAEPPMEEDGPGGPSGGDGDNDPMHGDDDGDDDEGEGEGDEDSPTGEGDPIPPSMDDTAAMAIFGDYHQFGSYMMSLNSRLKTMLNNIKSTADPTTRLITLQELSELLSISTEDTLAGSFQVEQYVRELVKILGGKGAEEDEDDGGDEDRPEQDEDAALAAALAISAGGSAYQGDENPEAQVLACRCLANLMEALPGVAHTVVYHGAIPVLCSKLIEITYIDLAEQTLSTLEKISEEFPSAIVREGGLAALLNYLDFFSIAVQRTALQAASNCCRNVSSDHFAMISGAWPIMRNCLAYSDQRLVEFACLCVIRVIDSYHRSSVENLEKLVDMDTIRAVNQLLLPAGGSPLIAANTYTLLLRALATASRASAKITLTLLEADIVATLYQILTGVLPSATGMDEEQGDASSGQGLGGGLADMAVMENLAHRPKDQVEEALSLISEVMPPLPKDGVFDHKSYTEKSLARLTKAKAKAERAAQKQAEQVARAHLMEALLLAPPPPQSASHSTEERGSSSTNSTEQVASGDNAGAAPVPPDRTETMRKNPLVVGRFMKLIVPILIDVYAASVVTPVRIKTLTSLLKATSFLDSDGLSSVLHYVPVASFASSILSSRDHPTLVIGALQLVDILLGKGSTLFKPTFRREGVFHEIESLADRNVAKKEKEQKDKDKESSDTGTPEGSVPPPLPAHSMPGLKKLSSLSLEPEDAITLRSRVVRFKYLSGDDKSEEDNVYQQLRTIVTNISSRMTTESTAVKALKELADLFASPHNSVSSFELLQGGVVDSLLSFIMDDDRSLDLQRRRDIFLSAFAPRKGLATSKSPLMIIVKKLQESLTRMESFDVVTISQSFDDSKRSSPSLLARQLRIRLVADEDSDIPKNLQNIVVSIHAIATFQALHDYLRPRVAGILGGGFGAGSRLSGMLAALAASGYPGRSAEPAEPPRPSSSSTSAPAPQSNPVDSSTSISAPITRRRSQRLSAKKSSGQLDDDDEAGEPATPTEATDQPGPSALAAAMESAPSETLVDSEIPANLSEDEDEIDAEVFDDNDDDPDNSISDKTVTLAVAEDGSKVEAQTPDGTRVATPGASAVDASSPSRSSLSSRPSYAAALKTKPTDWHLEFSIEDHDIPLDLTIYGAIHQHEMRKRTSALPPNFIWQGIYTVKFKKVSGPASDSRSDSEPLSKARSPLPDLSSLPEGASHTKILRLLRVLHHLNERETEQSRFTGEKRSLAESAFVNNKLTAKLTRQLEEPMIVASSCLPDWAMELPQHFPFLFPFATRFNFLQSTSFGYARLILKWQSQQPRNQENHRRDDNIGFLGRLQRQKVRISRKHLLESAVKVFELYGSSSSILEVEYFEEVGTGLGPTLEFYSLVSKEFARKDLKIWRDSDSGGPSAYVDHPNGLYPSPISPEDMAKDGGQKRTHLLRVIGQFIAKAMLDSRIIDLSFNKIFLKIVLGEDLPVTIANLRLVDSELADSLAKLQSIASGAENKMLRKLGVSGKVDIKDLALDFTIPGYDIELRPGGRDIPVTADNVQDYIQEVLDSIIGKGIQAQAKAFRDGFSKVFHISDLQCFSADELVMLFGNSDEDWSIETLSEAVKADHGFNIESKTIRDLLEVMSAYDVSSRRDYLQFITGSPKLPIGGFRGLNPPFTVVRKPHEPPLTANDYLPSVMTCVNYLKLPEYSTKDVLREKLKTAMKEGVGSFHLS